MYTFLQAIRIAQRSKPTQPDDVTELDSVNNDKEETASVTSETSSSSSGSRDETDQDNLISGEDSELQKEEYKDRDPQVLYRKTRSYKLRKLLLHGIFFVVGVSILIAGGVSSIFHPHVDTDQYSNCTAFDNNLSNFSDSYTSIDMTV